jgi:hypothetical protein
MHGDPAALVDEVVARRITSLPSFLLGSTFHGIKPLVKYQMDCGSIELRDSRNNRRWLVSPASRRASAMIESDRIAFRYATDGV